MSSVSADVRKPHLPRRARELQRRCLVAIATLAIATGGAAEPSRTVALDLYVGQAHLIDEGPVRRIAVGNGRVVQATALDDRQILVIPEAAGQSTLHVWPKSGGERLYVINVVPADVNRLLLEVRAMLGEESGVAARIVGDKIVLEGAGVAEARAVRLAEIARRYPQIVNLVGKVGLERMISMDVRMIEIKRDALQNLGIKWGPNASGPSFGVVGDLVRTPALRSGGAAEGVSGVDVRPRIAPFAASLGIATTIGSALNFMIQNGDAVVLAEPRLSCRSGGSARFVAGGELPIPFSSALGQTSVTFKEYGVKFDVSPVVGDSGVISAKIATEVSAINFEVTVREIPGLTKRRAETEVNLRENETLVIAGLLSEESARSIDKVSALGDLPVLGPLFRSRQFRDRQTDLAVFVTPRFVYPESGDGAAAADIATRRLGSARTRVRMVD